ncbi:MBL fold metallo-hydrolase [Sphaerisporangium perillae]|uniref:MBL fold metallo-hydrolase n=1 Tax=Sphaerisporangium perillae TaxID=2935860 RepID=UPI00200FDBF7|nr:MBL fold metallo-hydrolase [Sphaerisporangium perillae]
MKTGRRLYSAQRPADLGGGVWSVPVPIPGNPLGYTLVYAIESPAGPVLVDAGWNHEDAWAALRDGLAAVGVDVRSVRGVVVTHHHPDHAGLAGQVREASGAWIAMHEADAALVRLIRGLPDGSHRDFQAEMMRRAGAGSDADAVQRSARPDAPAQPDLELRDGDLVDLPGRVLRTVWTPGHTPGHVCLHLEDADRLFTGDHVLPGITPHIGIYPYDRQDVDPLGDFLASLTRVAELGDTEALPAHEWTFPDAAARAAEIRDHHEDKLLRLRDLMAGLPGEPLTIWEVAERMTWNRPWSDLGPAQRGMAAAEAAAHLRTLEVRDEVHRTSGAPGDPVRFTVTSY